MQGWIVVLTPPPLADASQIDFLLVVERSLLKGAGHDTPLINAVLILLTIRFFFFV